MRDDTQKEKKLFELQLSCGCRMLVVSVRKDQFDALTMHNEQMQQELRQACVAYMMTTVSCPHRTLADHWDSE